MAWVLIVVHFAAKFSDASGTNELSSLLTLETLVLAGLAFMWAAVVKRIDWRGCAIFASFAIPQLAYVALGVFSVSSTAAYVATVFIGFVLPIAVMMPIIEHRGERVLAVLGCAALAASLLIVIHYDDEPSDGVNAILCWLYLGAGILNWRRFPRPTAGALTVLGGFISWGMVFPVGVSIAAWLPHLHIDDTAYNIPKYIVAIGLILMMLEEQMERSTFLSLHDDLTGLPNRRKLEAHIDEVLERARRTGQRAALLTIDLDRFKTVNDSLGHHAGDQFLREVAGRFSQRIRRTDLCGRQGGDEFIVVAEHVASRGDAEAMAHALLATLEAPVEIAGQRIFAAASVGIALFPDDGMDAETLRAVSDQSMYIVKRQHRRRDTLKPVEPRAVAG